MRKIRSIAFVGFWLYLGAGEAAAQQVDLSDWHNCRGVNFTITGASNSIDQWLNYDPIAAEDNLDTLKAFGVNAVRVFGSYSVWDSKNWLDYTSEIDYDGRLADFAAMVFERDMVLMLVLFDAIGGAPTPPQPPPPGFTMTYLEYDASRAAWIRSPLEVSDPASNCWPNPPIAMPPAPVQPDPVCVAEYIARRNEYVTDTVNAVENAAGANDVFVFDLWNEPPGPQIIPRSIFRELNEHIKLTLASSGLTTVGTVSAKQAKKILDELALGGTKLDVLSYHPYAVFEEVVEKRHDTAEHRAGLFGIPHVITEIVHHGVGADCAHVLDWLTRLEHDDETVGEGFFLWEGFASETQFATEDGLFYEGLSGEPVTRDLEGVNKLLSLAIEDAFDPQAVAQLRPSSSSSFIEYSPVPYEVTNPDVHDMMVDWDAKYGVYRETVWDAYQEYEMNYVAANGLNDPSRLKFNAVLDFYEETFHWVESGLSRDFVDFTDPAYTAGKQELDDLGTTLVDLMNRPNPGSISEDDDVLPLEAQLMLVANTILGPYIEDTPIGSFDLTAPFNTAPEVVVFEASAEWVSFGPFLQVVMTGKLIVNDADRLSDLVEVDIQYSTDGGNTFTGLGLPWMADSGSIQTFATIPGLAPGQSFVCRGYVEDDDGDSDYRDVTLLPTGP